MTYRLGVDVGGTFTDLILVNESSGDIHTAKVPSTPDDSSVGVMNGVERVCGNAGIDPSEISQVMHGTTVATNTVLTGSGSKVGLVTTRGYKQVLQIARSYVPGGLGGWVIYNKSDPLAPLACTIEADERMGADGKVVRGLDAKALEKAMEQLKEENIEALTVSLINSYANPKQRRRLKRWRVKHYRACRFHCLLLSCRKCRSTSERLPRLPTLTCVLRWPSTSKILRRNSRRATRISSSIFFVLTGVWHRLS